jgi:hypothetical protein
VITERQFLVRYGRPGFIGRFASALALTRGERVVVRGPRGVELGEVLLLPEPPPRVEDHDALRTAPVAWVPSVPSVPSDIHGASPTADGEILRVATSADGDEAARLSARGQELLAGATTMDSALPLALVDVEVTLDGTAILHAVAWESCDASPQLEQLSARFGLAVKLLDLSRVAVEKDPTGCGKPNCGSESGGCSSCGSSTGSCSRGSVKSAEELTSYFADLRRQMETAGLVRTPLC